MNHKKSFILLQLGVLGGAIIVFLGLNISTTVDLLGSVISAIGLIAMLGGIGQAFIFYKCPHCDRRLTIRGKMPKYCPQCGGKLN